MTDPLAALSRLPGVADRVAGVRDAANGVTWHRALRRHADDIAIESRWRGALASWEMNRDADDNPADNAAHNLGSRRLAAELSAAVLVWRTSPLQALARLHTVIAADVLRPNELGRPRPSRDVAQRLDGLAQLITGGTAVSGVLLAAVIHGEIASMAPFVWGSGLVARAAERLTLVTSGVDPRAVMVPEVGHKELGSTAYRAGLEAYESGLPERVAAWVQHCARAMERGAAEGTRIADAMLAQRDMRAAPR
jgi:hypothetical protein